MKATQSAVPKPTTGTKLIPGTRSREAGVIQLVVPVYNEGENVVRLYRELTANAVPFDSLTFVYDLDTDTSLEFISRLQADDLRVIAEKNGYSRGVLNALRWAFSRVQPGPVIVIMGDCSDKLSNVSRMVTLWEDGATIVSPSRYMPGGKQYGGGILKSTLSRIAGKSLKLFGFPTSDATNNFKLYDGVWLRQQQIESVGGFEIALELCYKAFKNGQPIVEIPTEWRDRTAGKSNFKLFKWLPKYLKWYFEVLKTIWRSKDRP